MADKLLIPSIEQRLAGLIEVSRRANLVPESMKGKIRKPTITISREFGCEAYPAAEKLKLILEEKYDDAWAIVDRSLANEVAKNHELSADLLHNLGTRPRWLDDMLSTLSPRWHNERDHFQLLAQQIVALATRGNVIIVGMGAAIVTQSMKNCIHFRIFASQEYKIGSVAARAGVSRSEALNMIEKRQQAREKFVRDFLDKDINNIHFFHMLLNNDRNSASEMAETMASYLSSRI